MTIKVKTTLFKTIIVILDFKSNFIKYYSCDFYLLKVTFILFTKHYYYSFLRAVFRKPREINSSEKITTIPNQI